MYCNINHLSLRNYLGNEVFLEAAIRYFFFAFLDSVLCKYVVRQHKRYATIPLSIWTFFISSFFFISSQTGRFTAGAMDQWIFNVVGRIFSFSTVYQQRKPNAHVDLAEGRGTGGHHHSRRRIRAWAARDHAAGSRSLPLSSWEWTWTGQQLT